MQDKEKCPICGCEEYENIDVTGTGTTFYAGIKGSVQIICCINCGILRVSEESMKFRKLK